MSDYQIKSNGIGLPMVLFLIFLVLKLTNNIDWSWWWVTSPLWIAFGLAIVLTIVFMMMLRINKDFEWNL